MQISSVQQALHGVSRELMRNHLQHCAAHAARKGSRDSARKVYDEIIDLMYRHV
jgi:DNA-binding FrmR family transcriptional regulator